MEFFNNPLKLKYIGNRKYVQSKCLISTLQSKNKKLKIIENGIFSNANLEYILSKADKNYNDSFDLLSLKGLCCEIFAMELFENTMNYYLNFQKFIEGRFISSINNEKNYIINSSSRHIAKLIDKNRIVVLEKTKNNNFDKFGFFNIAEIDGLFMVKKNNIKKSMKEFYIIEAKSGKIKMSYEHIFYNIIKPFEYMYNSKFNYVLIGFKEDLYDNNKTNILNKSNTILYEKLKNLGVESSFIHFPFSKESFQNFTSLLYERKLGKIKGRAIYDINNKTLEFISYDGNTIKGTFIPDK